MRNHTAHVRVVRGSLMTAILANLLVSGCGKAKAPIFDDDPAAVRALKEAGANVLRLPLPGGKNKGEFNCRIELEGASLDAEVIQNLNNVPFVSELSFRNATDELLMSLGDFQALRTIDVTGSDVTNLGIQALASKDLPALHTLILDDTLVTGAGLADMPPQVRGLSLVNLPISDTDMEHMARLKGLMALTLSGTQVTAAGVRSARQSRPNLMVMGVKLN